MVAGRPMLGKASELVGAGRPMVMLEVENEACERLVSRLWWYKCYRGTLLREGTPPAVCPEHQNVSMLRFGRNSKKNKTVLSSRFFALGNEVK